MELSPKKTWGQNEGAILSTGEYDENCILMEYTFVQMIFVYHGCHFYRIRFFLIYVSVSQKK